MTNKRLKTMFGFKLVMIWMLTIVTISLAQSETNPINTYQIDAILWSPNGTYIATGHTNGISLWDGITGQLIQRYSVQSDLITNPRQHITRIAWHPVDDLIALSDGYALSIYTSNFRLINSVSLHDLPLGDIYGLHISWSPDGSRIAVNISGANIDKVQNTGRMLQLWNWDGASLHKIADIPAMHVPFGDGVAWHPNSLRFAAIELDTLSGRTVESINIYDVADASLITTLGKGILRATEHIEWSTDGSQIALDNNGLQIWDITTLTPLGVLTDRFNGEVELAYSPSENVVAFVNLDSYTGIQIWDTNTFQLIQTLEHPAFVRGFTWGTGGLVSTASDGMMRVWDVSNGQVLATFPTGTIGTPSWDPTGTRLIMFDRETRQIYIRSATSGEIVATFDPSSTSPTADSTNTDKVTLE